MFSFYHLTVETNHEISDPRRESDGSPTDRFQSESISRDIRRLWKQCV